MDRISSSSNSNCWILKNAFGNYFFNCFAVIFEIFDSNSLIPIPTASLLRELLRAIPYVLSLLFLILFSRKSLNPAALGIPFDKSKQ